MKIDGFISGIMGISVLAFLTMPGSAARKNTRGLSIREVFDLYVEAVQNSNVEQLFSTVTDREDFFFLTAQGRQIDSRQGYYRFHEEWFAEQGWDMPVELLAVHEGQEYGYTSAIFYYRQPLPEGGAYHLDSYFTLIFHQEDNQWKVVADICTPIQRYFTDANPEIRYDTEQMFLFDMIKNRRTVRKFKPAPVPDEHLVKILDAARDAPSAGNQQPWKFLVVRDRMKLDRLKDQALAWYVGAEEGRRTISPEERRSMTENLGVILTDVLSAPVYVAVLVDSLAPYPNYLTHDGPLAVANLMITARTLGYGTGYFTTFFPETQMREFFNIPSRYKLVCFTPIGVPENWPEMPEKKDLDQLIVYEQFVTGE